jgi:transcriptional regulator with XRE-family HTH domain
VARNPAKLKSHGTLVAEEIASDPEFREKWERLALARAVAAEALRYRVEHGLTQEQLAVELGMKQPQVARLEIAETQPAPETIAKVVGVTGAELAVDYVPAERVPRLLTKRAREGATVYQQGAGAVVVALAKPGRKRRSSQAS